ncbi:efflux RND transporter permease subunit [Pleionea sp. CnH1-48]|uniref:efflux RND transporter permease subunit n=1 Tax=Pleionea sp. CnH1-48 TaxID=2954494 RepID=UPI0020975AB1|nr:efflux RND transporter permease subunit [Pleionea sp. CnH1-48]MCO7225669.1 efflux RND transporter permease subunit [Pleionea sp. CnH1-48]
MNPIKKEKGLIAWFTYNSVAANLLMVFVILAGLVSYMMMTKRMMPDIQPNMVHIIVPYLGAAPEEVEQGVIIKLEEAIQDVKGIKRVRSTASEGSGSVMVELTSDTELDAALNEIKIQIDSIATFPAETEKPVIYKVEFSADVMWLSIFGDMDRASRQTIAREIRDGVMTLPQVNSAELMGNRAYEIAIELSEAQLESYGLTMSEVATAVRRSSLDLPGGTIKTDGGDIRLRTVGQAYTGIDYSQLVLRTNPDGTRLLLGDVAKINDGFVESDGYARYNGKRSSVIRVKSVGEQNDLEIAEAVRNYVAKTRETLPEGVNVEVWGDGSYYLQQRLDMMFDNMMMGALLVFILLTLFLRVRVALWVLVGIPICFFGAFLFMDKLGTIATNINFLSLFGFILVLGIVVDDAIIIGESIYSEVKASGHTKENVIIGAKRVAMPATFGVLTTIAAFAPMLTLDSIVAPFFEAISVVVILCLLFSLVESKLILPAHLAHMKYETYDDAKASRLGKVQHGIREGMERFAKNVYQPLLRKVAQHRYLTLLSFVCAFVLCIVMTVSGHLKFEMFPTIANDGIQVSFTLNNGSPISSRDAMVQRLEKTVQAVDERLSAERNDGNPIIDHMLSWTNGDSGGGMFVELTKGEFRNVNTFEFEKAWREEIGEVAGVKELRLQSGAGVGGDSALSFRLVGSNYENLEAASKELQNKLAEYDGVYDIRSSYSSGSQEIKLKLKPGAETLGLSLADLGRQVRQAFYGEEAQRIQRGKDEIKVMVRYPREERRSIANLENMRIRTPAGDWVPFSAVAEFSMGQGFASIQREDRKRAVSVRADIDPEKVETRTVVTEITQEFLPKMLVKYPGVSSELGGGNAEQQKFAAELGLAALVAIAMIYVLIAIPLKSYLQPFIVMSVIPFGLIGAFIGHMLLGHSLSMMSIFGLVALSGVVVNDSLILVDFVNRARSAGVKLVDAVLEAGVKRFRAIMLTSLTTFFGLLPILFEQSLQAQVIIPMAISLSFGIMFATMITLVLIPALYLILQDITGLFKSKKRKEEEAALEALKPALSNE